MKRIVLDIGNCNPDHNSIRSMLLNHFDVEVLRADQFSDALEVLKEKAIDLILINRKLDVDYSDGMDVLREIKKLPQFAPIPVMIVTNYPEHQEAAVREGAVYGFGKKELRSTTTLERLEPYLERKVLG